MPGELEVEESSILEIELEDSEEVVFRFDPDNRVAWLERAEDDEIEPMTIWDDGIYFQEAAIAFKIAMPEDRVKQLLSILEPI